MPPTPQLTFSPSPPGTPVYAPLDARPLPTKLLLAPLAARSFAIPNDFNAGVDPDVEDHTRTPRSRAAVAAQVTRAQALNAHSVSVPHGMEASRPPILSLHKKRQSNTDTETLHVDTDHTCSSGESDCNSGPSKYGSGVAGTLPGCGRTLCRNCCFENMQS